MICVSNPDRWILCRYCAKSFRVYNVANHKLTCPGARASERGPLVKAKRLASRTRADAPACRRVIKSFWPTFSDHSNLEINPTYCGDANNNEDEDHILSGNDSSSNDADKDNTEAMDTYHRLKIYRRQRQDSFTQSTPLLNSLDSTPITKYPQSPSLYPSKKQCPATSQHRRSLSSTAQEPTGSTSPIIQPRVLAPTSMSKYSLNLWKELPEPRIVLDRCDSSRWFPPESNAWDMHKNFVFKCHTCPARFDHPAKLSTHTRTHNSQRHACRICDRKFPFILWLEQHVRTHTDPQPRNCNYCEETFPTSRELNLHIADEHEL